MILPVRSRASGPFAGFPIGILALETRHHLVAGNVQHAGSFAFPVFYGIVRDVSGPALMRGDPDAAEPIVRGAMALEAAGVEAIVGACGSFANYQLEVASAVDVPVFMSILLEVPLLLRALPAARQLGIIFASTGTFTDRVRRQCGIEDSDRIVAIGADAVSAFQPILAQEGKLDDASLRAGLVDLVAATLRAHPAIGAWLLQCSDLPPYAAAIQRATGRPVFDMVTLIRHVHDVVRRVPFID
jgi:hypothetical protein